MTKHGEHGAECAQSYVEYGRALLRKVQTQDDPFGSKLPGRNDKQPTAAGGGGSSSKEGEGGADADAADAATNDADEPAHDEGEGEEESDDLELAFQVLEVARLIYEKQPTPETEMALAEVRELIGDVQMENEAWEDAIKDIKASLEIRERRLPPTDRILAHMHYQLGTATVALVEKQRAQAKEHYTAAAEVRQQRLDAWPAGASDAERQAEETELRELLAEVRAKVEETSADSRNAGTPAPAAQAAPPALLPVADEDGGVTTIGFDNPPQASVSTALQVQSLNVVKKKKAVLEPLSQNPSDGAIGDPSSKNARIE